MKFNKLILGTLCVTSLSAPLISLTSCGGNKDPEVPETGHITYRIVGNVTPGQDMTIEFTNDDVDNYCFDILNSKITFANSNTDVYVKDCEINLTTSKITVPGRLVTSSSATVSFVSAKHNIIDQTTLENEIKNTIVLQDGQNHSFSGTMTASNSSTPYTFDLITKGKDYKLDVAKTESSAQGNAYEKSYYMLTDNDTGVQWKVSKNGESYLGEPCTNDTYIQELLDWDYPLYPYYSSVNYQKSINTYARVISNSIEKVTIYYTFDSNKKIKSIMTEQINTKDDITKIKHLDVNTDKTFEAPAFTKSQYLAPNEFTLSGSELKGSNNDFGVVQTSWSVATFKVSSFGSSFQESTPLFIQVSDWVSVPLTSDFINVFVWVDGKRVDTSENKTWWKMSEQIGQTCSYQLQLLPSIFTKDSSITFIYKHILNANNSNTGPTCNIRHTTFFTK